MGNENKEHFALRFDVFFKIQYISSAHARNCKPRIHYKIILQIENIYI